MLELAALAARLPDSRGPLGLLSSDEFTPAVADFDRALISLTGPRVGLVLCADHRAAPQSARLARAHFARLGADAFVLDMHTDEPLPHFDLAYVGGGSPKALLDDLARNPRWRDLEARWHGGAGLAGSSAGAMALAEHCLLPEPGATMPTTWARGLGSVRDLGLAVHASSRPWEWLDEVLETAPAPVLVLDDATGVVIDPEGTTTSHGPGRARIVAK